MFPREGRKWLIHLTAREQPLKDAMEFIHRNESTGGKEPGLTQTFCVISARSHHCSASQIFVSKIEIYWLGCKGGSIWFHFSFQKNPRFPLKLKHLSGARGEQQMLQEGLFMYTPIRAGCTGLWLWSLLFGLYRETPGNSHRSCSYFGDVRWLMLT